MRCSRKYVLNMSVWSVCLFCSSAKKTSRQSIHAQYISANHTVGPSPSFVKMSRNLVESLRSKVGSYNAPKWYQDQEYWRQERIFYQWSRLIDNNKSEALITHHTDIYLFRSLHTSRRGCKYTLQYYGLPRKKGCYKCSNSVTTDQSTRSAECP